LLKLVVQDANRSVCQTLLKKIVKHHRGFGGVSQLNLNHNAEKEQAIELTKTLDGVKEVLDRQTAATRFKLMASHIGDLVVLPDIDTVFDDLRKASERLNPACQSHGSLYEMDIPISDNISVP